MTGALDTTARRLASRLIGKYGKALTYKQAAGGTYDPATQTTTGGTLTSHAVNGYLGPQSARYLGDKYGTNLIQGGELEVSLDAAGLGITPAPGDLLALEGVDRRVIVARPNYSGELVYQWDLLVRRG
jgi:hypothetical protein